ncbi:MAG: DUF4364 family protein [Defluviitaleaceae bacterium]|nr:DUF4364 family protein [Defluviitaleaceae bacterium]
MLDSPSKMKNNILILYLLHKMDLPLTISQIEQVLLNYMNYFTLQEAIQDLLDIKYIESNKERNLLRYIITEDGFQSLKYFEKSIPSEIRDIINKYILENRNHVKRDYETIASYFKQLDSDDYIVKCALYEDDIMLMEINISVVSINQAKLICENWENNITKLYASILKDLITTKNHG